MRSALASALLVVLALFGCGKAEDWNEPESPASTAQANQQPTSKAAARTILNVVVAGTIDAKGFPVGEAYTFAPDQPQITVIARVGKVAEGASIRFAWYQETDDEDEPLFDQAVPVASFDRAYSQGKNPGTLAAGIYRVTATLGDDVREIEFTVEAQPAKPTRGAASGDEAHWLSVLGVSFANAESPASEPDPGAPPAAGASGAIQGPLPASDTAPLSPVARQCGVDLLTYDGNLNLNRNGSLHDDYSHSHLGFVETILVRNQCGDGQSQGPTVGAVAGGVISASHNGVSVEAHLLSNYPPDMIGYEVDPCASGSGWDLPHEKVTVTFRPAIWPASSPAPSAVYELYGDASPPTLEVHSTPAKNTKVKAGDKIEIKITARDDNPNVWESGLQKMWMTGPAGDVGKAEVNPSPVMQACAKKARKHTYTTTYTVPAHPLDLIELCAHAQDYAGNKREKCTTFPTVDCRNLTFHYDVRVAGYRRVVETWKEVHPGTVTTTADWTGQWSNVGVSVEQCALSVKILMPAVQAPDLHPATGEIQLKYDFNDALQASDPNPLLDVYNGAPPCRYHNEVRFPATMFADAGARQGAPGGMHFDFEAKPGPNAASFSRGTCPAGGPAGRSREIVGVRGGESSADNELKSIRGWNWGISDGILSINNQRAPVSPPPFPFAALLAGKGFSLDSGLQSAAVMGTNGPGSAQVTDRLVVSFSPAAKR